MTGFLPFEDARHFKQATVDLLRRKARRYGDKLIERGGGFCVVDGETGEIRFPTSITLSGQLGTITEVGAWMGVPL